MNICITGGAGFIGSEMVRQLIHQGHKVVVVDSLTYAGNFSSIEKFQQDFEFHQVDIRDMNSLKQIFRKRNFDVVANCAAETHVDNSI